MKAVETRKKRHKPSLSESVAGLRLATFHTKTDFFDCPICLSPNSTPNNWPKSELAEVKIGRSRNWPKSNKIFSFLFSFVSFSFLFFSVLFFLFFSVLFLPILFFSVLFFRFLPHLSSNKHSCEASPARRRCISAQIYEATRTGN